MDPNGSGTLCSNSAPCASIPLARTVNGSLSVLWAPGTYWKAIAPSDDEHWFDDVVLPAGATVTMAPLVAGSRPVLYAYRRFNFFPVDWEVELLSAISFSGLEIHMMVPSRYAHYNFAIPGVSVNISIVDCLFVSTQSVVHAYDLDLSTPRATRFIHIEVGLFCVCVTF